MREFFRGWRRKLGVVTLVIACGFAIGWARSLHVIDVIIFPTGSQTAIAVSTAGYSIACRVGFDEEGQQGFDVYQLSFSAYKPDQGYYGPIHPGFEDPVDWRFQWCGFGFGETPQQYRHFLRQSFLIIPLYSIVLPLTALSACFLLISPRQSNPNKPPEPIAPKLD